MRVMIQNQHGAGKIAKKWDRTGLILENLGYNKYRVKVDGSGHVTDCNRQYLRQFSPITSPQPGPRPTVDHFPKQVEEPAYQPIFEPEPVVAPQQPMQTAPEPHIPSTPITTSQPPSPTSPESPSFVTPPTTPVANEPPVENQPPRRSTRIRKPIERLTYDKF